ncbi:MAG: cyclophilin [Nitrosomonadales bacterium]|nr:cyclophilin [Nitrosomonadales bacterium]|tara:strand:- start:1414 stop:1899 length:486 start_codon:yes stop_codon:yes gene_type:complete
MIKIKTNLGSFSLELNQEKAPISSKNFENYVNKGFYNQTIFHRVIDSFMIQGGGFDAQMNQKGTDSPIKNEAANGLKNEKYTIAMARTSVPDSATSQFFINTSDNSFLDYPGQDGAGYCVFGKVIEGTETIDKINSVQTGSSNGHQDVPIDAVIIEEVSTD